MAESTQLQKGPPVEPSKDFALLREKGMEIIRQLAQDSWTDHNLTDPGITALEVFAYAITEIGHRAHFDIKDVLASSNPAGKSSLIPARESLAVHPVTADDLRKVLIDQEGIRNAWVHALTTYRPTFSYNNSLDQFCFGASAGERIDLKGLYEVLLEFEEDPNLGDLNQSIFSRTIEIVTANGSSKYVTLEIGFPFLDDEEMELWREKLNFIAVEGVSGPEITLLEAEGGIDYIADLVVHYDDDGTKTHCIRVSIRLSAIEPLTEDEEDNLKITINDILTKIPATGFEDLEDCQTDGSLVYCYNQKVILVHQILREMDRRMGGFRNLSEIFHRFHVARIQEISIQTNLDVGPEADVERLLAEIYFEIDQFLAPYARQRSLSYMQEEKGLLNEQIFEGPALDNGFIDIGELQQIPSTAERKVIRTSDIVNLIMSLRTKESEVDDLLDLPVNRNIIAISKLALSNYIENQLICEDVTDCLALVQDGQYLPRLSLGKSEISVFRDGEEVPYDADLVMNHFLLIKRQSLEEDDEVEGPFDLEVEPGTPYDFQDYYSIQEDFPRTYGIGEAGLADNESDERKAQAKQFQGFLYFFEQLLANFATQLSHIQDFFAISSDQAQSYFFQELYQLPGISYLLEDAKETDTAWYDFVNDSSNVYVQKLLAANESTDVFLDRRHRLLNHLMARFAENMEEYLLVRYSIGLRGVFDPINPDYEAFNAHRQALSRSLIADKECFLQDYDEIGYNRNKASNIQIGHPFDQLAFSTTKINEVIHHQWVWRDPSNADRIHGFNNANEVTYESKQAAEDAAHEALKIGTFSPAIDGNNVGNYLIQTINSVPVTYFYTLVNLENETIARSKNDFNSVDEAVADIREIAAFMRDVWHSSNVSNLEKRFSRLLGLKRWGRHSLSTPHHIPAPDPLLPEENRMFFLVRDINAQNTDPEKYKLLLLDEDGETLLTSEKDYALSEVDSENFPYEDSKTLVNFGLLNQHYEIDTDHKLKLKDENGNTLANREFTTAEEAQDGLKNILNFISKHFSREGFHMVEHILLRPLEEDADSTDPPFLYIPQNGGVVEDPYSFRLTFIFPTGCDRNFAMELEDSKAAAEQPALFQDSYWKQFVEKTIRRETPAHIYPEIFWLDVERAPSETEDYLTANAPLTPAERSLISLNHFEKVYEDWLQITANFDKQSDTLLAEARVAAKKELLNTLNNLYQD